MKEFLTDQTTCTLLSNIIRAHRKGERSEMQMKMKMNMKMRDEAHGVQQVGRCLTDRGCSPLADQVLRPQRTRTNLQQVTSSLVVDSLTISR